MSRKVDEKGSSVPVLPEDALLENPEHPGETLLFARVAYTLTRPSSGWRAFFHRVYCDCFSNEGLSNECLDDDFLKEYWTQQPCE